MTEDLTERIARLSPAPQSAANEFIEFRQERRGKAAPASFLETIDEFIAGHPELLRRLAQ